MTRLIALNGLIWMAGVVGLSGLTTGAVAAVPAYRITVNSGADGAVTPDAELTLREGILLANGELLREQLSEVEQALVVPAGGPGSVIGFDLAADQRVIRLVEVLPAIATDAVTIDGTPTEPGEAIPTPGVALTPAAGREVFRGLTITADRVTVRGLSLYGFRSDHRSTQTTPPADIFISHAPPPADGGPDSPPVTIFGLQQSEVAPQDVVIENNWLGLLPDESRPDTPSAFGVSVFNAVGTVIRNNRIQYHEGSAVITLARGQDLQLTDNVIIGNGVAGMPDAVRLEGQIDGALIQNNLICGNDGSGIFLFKPEGAAIIRDNDIRLNGRRFERAAIYLMGRSHQVLDNRIGYQPGPGVAISAFPTSDRNVIRGNRFTQLEGLSIDLAAQHNTGRRDFQQADGINPPRNSDYRRLDTANGAINAPSFGQARFTSQAGRAVLVGTADPGTEVDLYEVTETGTYGPLNRLLATVTADAQGRFQLPWDQPQGVWVSAIATDPSYGTSEPSPVVQLVGLEGTMPERSVPSADGASCTAPPEAARPAATVESAFKSVGVSVLPFP